METVASAIDNERFNETISECSRPHLVRATRLATRWKRWPFPPMAGADDNNQRKPVRLTDQMLTKVAEF